MISVSAHQIAIILSEALTSSLICQDIPNDGFISYPSLGRLPKDLFRRFGGNLRKTVLRGSELADLDCP